MPIKILNLIDSLNAGGAESRLKNLVLEKYSVQVNIKKLTNVFLNIQK